RGYRGELVDITPMSAGNRFQLTPEHPVRAIRRERVRSSLRASGRWPDVDARKLEKAEPEFVPAGQLAAGDLLVFPINKIERDAPELSDDFLSLLGYYVAEGCATHFNGHQAVEFSLGSHETENIAEVTELIRRVTGKNPSLTIDT